MRWMVMRLLPIVLALALAAAPAGAATVSYKNVRSPTGQISCMAVQYGSGIECTAPYLPDIGPLDTYLALHAHGKAQQSERGDSAGYISPFRTLHYGDVWKRPGIRCSMKRTGLTCRNRDEHGFHIQKGHVRRF
jgi:hypothetical protein